MNDFDLEGVVEEIMSDPDAFGMDDDDVEDTADWYPEEYVIMFNGFRGSGKSLGVCWFGCWHLKHRDDIEVYTDLNYNMENLKRDGFKSLPKELDWDKLITWGLDQPIGALNQIDEVDTKLDKLRTVTNQNLVATKFLEQIRKRSLKFVLSCQFGHYLPYGTLDQVDLNIHCHDLFFTPAGRENGLKKGERFLYVAQDKSGYFTGGRQNIPICFTLNGRGIWDYYQTDKIHDVLHFAKKFKWKSEEHIIDSSGEMYPGNEDRAQEDERQLRQMRQTIGVVWGGQFMAWMQANAERLNLSDNGNYISVRRGEIEKVLQREKGQKAKNLAAGYSQLKAMAERGGVVRGRNRTIIDILKPELFKRPDEEVIPGPGPNENQPLWGDDE